MGQTIYAKVLLVFVVFGHLKLKSNSLDLGIISKIKDVCYPSQQQIADCSDKGEFQKCMGTSLKIRIFEIIFYNDS